MNPARTWHDTLGVTALCGSGEGTKMTESSDEFTEEELLSFVQGSAAPDLAARIEEVRGQNRTLEAEIALMTSLKPAMALSTGDMNSPGELDWRRLETAIRQETSQAAPQAQPARSGNVIMWQAAAALFAVVAIGQAAYTTLGPSLPEPGYETALPGSYENVLAISFTANATEAELREVLLSARATLVDGPGASGLYRVAFQSPEALAEGRQILENAPIIDLVLDE